VSLAVISFDYEPEFAELTVGAVDGEFRGIARAVLAQADIHLFEEFIAKLRIYPLEECSLTLAHADLVRLTAFQEDASGHCRLVVELGGGIGPDQRMLRIGIRQDWTALMRLSQELARMIGGEPDRIEIREEVR